MQPQLKAYLPGRSDRASRHPRHQLNSVSSHSSTSLPSTSLLTIRPGEIFVLGDVDVRACACIASLHPLSCNSQRNAHDQVARCRSSTTAAPGRISKKVDAKSNEVMGSRTADDDDPGRVGLICISVLLFCRTTALCSLLTRVLWRSHEHATLECGRLSLQLGIAGAKTTTALRRPMPGANGASEWRTWTRMKASERQCARRRFRRGRNEQRVSLTQSSGLLEFCEQWAATEAAYAWITISPHTSRTSRFWPKG